MMDPVRRTRRLEEMMSDPDQWTRQRLCGLKQLVDEVRPNSVLEIGCQRGHSTELFLLYADRVVALDPWTDEAVAEQGDDAEEIFREFSARCLPYPGLEIVRGRSPDAVRSDWRFDLVYIDGDHSYEAVRADISATHALCGNLAGHDWNLPGVGRALEEHCAETGRSFVKFSDMSWLIR